MHVPDGFLPLTVTLGGFVGAAVVTAVCLSRIARRPDPRADLPRVAMLTAAFFAASLVHVPVPPGSVHLLLSGLMGVLLGWFAFPAILVGLFFQAVMFGHGGITTLGVNALVIGLPALVAAGLFHARGAGGPGRDAVFGFLAGGGAVLLAVGLFAAMVIGNLPAHIDPAQERRAIGLLALAMLPLAVLEGVLVAAIVGVLRRVDPGLLRGV